LGRRPRHKPVKGKIETQEKGQEAEGDEDIPAVSEDPEEILRKGGEEHLFESHDLHRGLFLNHDGNPFGREEKHGSDRQKNQSAGEDQRVQNTPAEHREDLLFLFELEDAVGQGEKDEGIEDISSYTREEFRKEGEELVDFRTIRGRTFPKQALNRDDDDLYPYLMIRDVTANPERGQQFHFF
jgi:hypothetical protein